MSAERPREDDGSNGGLSRGALQAAVDHAGHLLPGQRPIEAFVHHNTLHVFEDLPFEDAVREASRKFGANAYMPEAKFREAYRAARIFDRDLDAVLDRHVRDEVLEISRCGLSEREAVHRLMLAMPEDVSGPALAWRLSETSMLRELPEELPRAARERLSSFGPIDISLSTLWEAVYAYADGEEQPAPTLIRPRDRAVAEQREDPDERVHSVLIRWTAAYLDHGQAQWQLTDRAEGFYVSLRRNLGAGGVPIRGWMRPVRRRLQEEEAAKLDSLESALATLRRMKIGPDELEAVVERTLLALPGFAGMFVQLTERPDLRPGPRRPTDLVDFLAIRLLLDEAALDAVSAGPAGMAVDPVGLKAWRLFHAAMIVGVSPEDAQRPEALRDLDAFMQKWAQPERERLWQLSKERRYRISVLDGVVTHHRRTRREKAPTPRAQVVTCIDDREESLRRHLEELDPRWETLGAAANYGLQLLYLPLEGGRAQPLCPAGIVPTHLLREVPVDEKAWEAEKARRKRAGSLGEVADAAGGSVFSGAVAALAGVVTAIPLVASTIAPGWSARRKQRTRPNTRLLLDLDHACDHEGPQQIGFTHDEMVSIVEGQLRAMGLTRNFAPLVVLLGHGSDSANNPHDAAYNCGACGGGRGGPNARAVAQMANRDSVRASLAERGITIPDTTWVIGGYHNTADDAVDWYDLDAVPASFQELLADLRADIEVARRRDAHERCRRFEHASLELDPDEALAHVEERSLDLAQPRPELGHATNALCFVGRRQWSRGLFLDRRVFLTSYDPETDPDGSVREAVAAMVAPVVAGINLEYYFSFVDRDHYGANTKLPHNVTGLVGVMDGHGSDLRTGLPWEMVEIHRPLRLMMVVEATPEQLEAIIANQPGFAKLVNNRWILLAAFDPESGRAWFYQPTGFEPHVFESAELPQVELSADWYHGRRDDLSLATIASGRPAGRPEAS